MTLAQRIKNIIEQSFCMKPGESLTVIVDEPCLEVGELFYSVALEEGFFAVIIRIPALEIDGAEPPMIVAEAMRSADVALCATSKSLTHTNARIEATAQGTRVITMPGITLDMIESGAAGADLVQVERLTTVLTEKLSKASTAVIEKEGCRLVLDLAGRLGISSPGIFRESGSSGNFPSGEAFIAPREGGAEGSTIIDGSMVGIGLLDDPLEVSLSKGKLVELKGKHAPGLSILFETPENATIAELGIGTNEAARLTGVILEDEKIYGTVHIAFGTNTSFGGVNKAALHYDGVILAPTLYLDDELIIEDGEFRF